MAQLVESKSIYHGLPVMPDELTGLTAIVTGANGISGDYMLRVLCESPRRWSKIYALSRRPPHGTWPAHVQHVSVDLLRPAEEVAAELQRAGVAGDYVFFFAYVQPPAQGDGGIWSAADELVRLNQSLLANFVEALALNHSLPKRLLLQLGAKYYGLHLGPAQTPQSEEDGRVDGAGTLGPNFYYAQEDWLRAFAARHPLAWTTTRPSHVLGAVPDAAMNLCLPLGVYGAVQRARGAGAALDFPADWRAWETVFCVSSARLNAYFSQWLLLVGAEAGQPGEAFNLADGCALTWGRQWPALAAYFGLPWHGPPDEADGDGAAAYDAVFTTPLRPPPRGYGPPATLRSRFRLADWAAQPDVRDAWAALAMRHGLRCRDLAVLDAVFRFTDMALACSFPVLLSMNKARKRGYFGFVDSGESMLMVMDEFVGLKMLPPRE